MCFPFPSGLPAPVAVTNLMITYTEQTNNFTITWTDLLNVNVTDRGYRISYHFSALNTQLATDTATILNVGKDPTSFEQVIQAGQYGVAGVTLSVTVQACSNVSLGEPTDTSHSLIGGEFGFFKVRDEQLFVSIMFSLLSCPKLQNLIPINLNHKQVYL